MVYFTRSKKKKLDSILRGPRIKKNTFTYSMLEGSLHGDHLTSYLRSTQKRPSDKYNYGLYMYKNNVSFENFLVPKMKERFVSKDIPQGKRATIHTALSMRKGYEVVFNPHFLNTNKRIESSCFALILKSKLWMFTSKDIETRLNYIPVFVENELLLDSEKSVFRYTNKYEKKLSFLNLTVKNPFDHCLVIGKTKGCERIECLFPSILISRNSEMEKRVNSELLIHKLCCDGKEYPVFDMKRKSEWYEQKKVLAESQCNVSLLPLHNYPFFRKVCHDQNIMSWKDPRYLKKANELFTTDEYNKLCNLENTKRMVQLQNSSGKEVFLGKDSFLERVKESLRDVKHAFYVDFETTEINKTDYTEYPTDKSKTIIYMIGCYYVNENGEHHFRQWVSSKLTLESEREVLAKWSGYMYSKKGSESASILHWGSAEPDLLRSKGILSFFDSYSFVDLCNIARKSNLCIRGAYTYSLKDVIKNAKKQGIIKTNIWSETNEIQSGDQTVPAILEAQREANEKRKKLHEIEITYKIRGYNYFDCIVMYYLIEALQNYECKVKMKN